MAEAAETKTTSNFGSGSKYNNNSNGSKSQEYDVTNVQEKSAVEGNTEAKTISTCDIRNGIMNTKSNNQQQ